MLAKEEENAYKKKNGRTVIYFYYSYGFSPCDVFLASLTHVFSFSFFLLILFWFVFSRLMSSQICTSESNRPCRYQIREKVFTFSHHFKIKDESGRDKYTVRSKKWTLKKKLLLEDSNGK
jgi:hypothetical protein